MASPDTILKLDTLVMIQTKFGFNWSNSFTGDDFLKGLRPGMSIDFEVAGKLMRTAVYRALG